MVYGDGDGVYFSDFTNDLVQLRSSCVFFRRYDPSNILNCHNLVQDPNRNMSRLSFATN